MVYEFASDKLLIYFKPTDLILVEHMQFKLRITESAEMYQMTPLPGVGPKTFPFVALSGGDSLRILNTANGYAQPLV